MAGCAGHEETLDKHEIFTAEWPVSHAEANRRKQITFFLQLATGIDNGHGGAGFSGSFSTNPLNLVHSHTAGL